MKNDDSRTPQISSSLKQRQALRRRAEKLVREKESLSPGGPQAVLQEETQNQLHELLVHQIELEMQNDELRRAQAELEEARERYLDLYDLAPVGYCTLTEDGIIQQVNLTAANLLGVPRGALIGQSITRFIHKEEQDGYYLNKLRLFETGEPQSYELQMTRSDGTPFWANLAANILRDTDGELKCRVVISDINEHKLAEEAVRVSGERLLEMGNSLAAEVEALRRLHLVNSLFIRENEIGNIYREILDAAVDLTHADCGTMQMTVDNGNALEIVSSRNLSVAFQQYFQRVVHGGVCGSAFMRKDRVIVKKVSQDAIFDGALERRVLMDDGICCVQSTPMFDSTGSVLGVLTTHYKAPHEFNERELRMLDLLARQAADVIERVQIEEALQDSESRALDLAMELEKKNRFVTDFFINISHELKTPITLIMLALDIIESYLRQPELNRAGITNRTAIMKQNANRLSRLVSNILDITKIDAGFMEPKLAVVDIVQLIHSLVESMDSYALKKRLQIEFASSAETKRMPVDSQIIERIILNLVSNAIKHTQEGGKILISFLNKGSQIMISVKDNGEGIPDEKKAIIFDRFRQVNTSFTRSNEGSGVGLSLIKALVELLGGHIWFESTLGEGSEFFVELPVLQMEEKNQLLEQNSMTIDKRIEMEFSDILLG